MTDRAAHWNAVYATKQPSEVGWYQSKPVRSLELLEQSEIGPTSTIIDVGGGDSTLPAQIAEELGDAFRFFRGFDDVHCTPSGAEQRFSYAVLRRR